MPGTFEHVRENACEFTSPGVPFPDLGLRFEGKCNDYLGANFPATFPIVRDDRHLTTRASATVLRLAGTPIA